MRSLRYQRGITLSGLIMGSIVFGILALGFMKLWPIFNEKLKVDQAMERLQNSPEGYRLSKTEMAKVINNQFDVSDVDTFDMPRILKVLQVGKKKGSPNKVALFAYEIRGPLVANLDIVMNYKKMVEFAPPKSD